MNGYRERESTAEIAVQDNGDCARTADDKVMTRRRDEVILRLYIAFSW